MYIRKIRGKSNVSLAEAEHLLEHQTITNSIATINWKEFDYLPRVQFRIGHTGDEIWLKYYVNEQHLRALKHGLTVMFTKTVVLSFLFRTTMKTTTTLNSAV